MKKIVIHCKDTQSQMIVINSYWTLNYMNVLEINYFNKIFDYLKFGNFKFHLKKVRIYFFLFNGFL